MPFYEYECSDCKFYVEALQKITEPPLTKCPSCGKETLQRLISAPVFRLKGAGWYETDFKSDKENKRNLADDKEPSASSDSDDSKTKVRASKALKKAAAKKSPGKKTVGKKVPAKKSAGKTSSKTVKPAGKAKVAKKPGKLAAKPATKKAAKKVAKKPAKKVAKKK
ncbi:MAG: zinc ribbon domain-containing protein [Steroidobacteraceae bacterium]